MAFTNAPETQTYGTHRYPAAYEIQARPNNKYFFDGGADYQDAGMVNILPVKDRGPDGEERIIGETRQCLHVSFTAPGSSGSYIGVNRGSHVWEKTASTRYYFTVCGRQVYASTDPNSWGTTALFSFTTDASTPVRFAEFIDATNVKKLVVVDGVEGYVITDNTTATKITDVDFPSPHVPFPIFIDGYLFLAKADTGDIYNSDLNDPAIWSAGSYISSELYPDNVVALVKENNYLVAIGTQGCEYFYDAANATASPLARQEGASLPFGTLFPNTIASNKNSWVMIANRNDGENTVVRVENQKYEDVNPGFLISALNSRFTSISNTVTASMLRGFLFRQNGILYYALAFDGVTTTSPVPPGAIKNGTFAYSFDTGMWTELRYGSDGTSFFPVFFSCITDSGNLSTYVSGHLRGGNGCFFGRMEQGTPSPFTFSTGAVDQYRDQPGNVTSTNIYQEVRTPNFDFMTQNRKSMNRFGINVQNSAAADTTTITVQYTDNDYYQWSTSRSLDATSTTDFPFLTQLGSFRRRAFKLTNTGDILQWIHIEMDINKGQQ